MRVLSRMAVQQQDYRQKECTEFEPSETEGHSVLGIRAQQCDYNNATDHHLPTNRRCHLDSDSVGSYNH